MSPKDEWILDVPREWMANFSGFTIDTGGSVMKIIYRHKQDWEELKDSDKGRLRFISFSRADRAKGMDTLKQNCYMSNNAGEDKATLFTTGVGSFQFAKTINTTFNAKLENISEFDCFAKAFTYSIAQLPQEELFYPICTEEETKIKNHAKEMLKLFSPDNMENITDWSLNTTGFEAITDRADDVMPTGIADPEDLYPCMLVMCGSGIGFIQIEKDGSFKLSDGVMRGGRCFLAMGSLLTGAKTYDDLVGLAAKGNPYNVHYCNSDMAKEAQGASEETDGSGGIYEKAAEITDDSYLYMMGKAVGKDRDDFNIEDIAAAYLQTFTSDLTQCLELCIQLNSVKRIFWCGSFIKAEVVRKYITLELRRRSVNVGLMQGKIVWTPSHFLKHGAYLGALGCVINSVDQFLKPPSEVAAEKAAKQTAQ